MDVNDVLGLNLKEYNDRLSIEKLSGNVAKQEFYKGCIYVLLLLLAHPVLAESPKPIPNKASPKLLDEMELFAVMCNRSGNGKDARLVRSWVKQLSGE